MLSQRSSQGPQCAGCRWGGADWLAGREGQVWWWHGQTPRPAAGEGGIRHHGFNPPDWKWGGGVCSMGINLCPFPLTTLPASFSTGEDNQQQDPDMPIEGMVKRTTGPYVDGTLGWALPRTAHGSMSRVCHQVMDRSHSPMPSSTARRYMYPSGLVRSKAWEQRSGVARHARPGVLASILSAIPSEYKQTASLEETALPGEWPHSWSWFSTQLEDVGISTRGRECGHPRGARGATEDQDANLAPTRVRATRTLRVLGLRLDERAAAQST